MTEQITINNRTYTIISRQAGYAGVEYVTVETKGGERKRAQFYQGEFDCWADSGLRKAGKYTRVNMRGR